MSYLRNLPVFLWWIVCIAAIIKFPVALLVFALIFLAATPFRSFIITEGEAADSVEVDPALAITKYSLLHDMTALTTVKALNAVGEEVRDPNIKILDVSHREGTK